MEMSQKAYREAAWQHSPGSRSAAWDKRPSNAWRPRRGFTNWGPYAGFQAHCRTPSGFPNPRRGPQPQGALRDPGLRCQTPSASLFRGENAYDCQFGATTSKESRGVPLGPVFWYTPVADATPTILRVSPTLKWGFLHKTVGATREVMSW